MNIVILVVCWLILRKARVQNPGQTSKRKNMKIFLPLSRFLAKTLRVNKIEN